MAAEWAPVETPTRCIHPMVQQLVDDKYERGIPSGSTAAVYKCKNCTWQYKGTGLGRLLMHVMGDFTITGYKKRFAVEMVPPGCLEVMRSRAGKGDRCKPCCAQPVSTGLAVDQEHAERLHLIAAVRSGLSFRAMSDPAWVELFEAISTYEPPSRKKLALALSKFDELLKDKVTDYLHGHGPWTLAHDGASSGDNLLLNVTAANGEGAVLHLGLIDAEDKRKTGEMLAGVLLAQVDRAGVNNIGAGITDSARSCLNMQDRLSNTTGMERLACFRCCEHGAHLLFSDVVKAVPWLRRVIKNSNDLARFVYRKKNLRARIKRTAPYGHGGDRRRVMPRMRAARKTRFGGRYDMLSAVSKNLPHLLALVHDGSWDQAVGRPQNDEERARFEAMVKLVKRPTFPTQINKALAVLKPAMLLIRKNGSTDFFSGLRAWAEGGDEILAMLREHDYVDVKYKETAGAKTQRAAAVKERLAQRMKTWLGPAHHCAFVMDARLRGTMETDAQAPRGSLSSLWAMAKTRGQHHIRWFFPAQPDQDEALKHFREYLKGEGLYDGVAYPPPNATVAEMVDWWLCSQPSHLLSRLMKHMACYRLSQGDTEREWAVLSRHCTPLRSRLSATAKGRLLNIHYNASLYTRGVPSKLPRLQPGVPVSVFEELDAEEQGGNAGAAGSNGDVENASADGGLSSKSRSSYDSACED